MNAPAHPDVTVPLTGRDGNAFAIIGRVTLALIAAGKPEAASEFRAHALACASYDELLQLAMETVEVE